MLTGRNCLGGLLLPAAELAEVRKSGVPLLDEVYRWSPLVEVPSVVGSGTTNGSGS